MEASDTILCSNCSRQIPTANYALHEHHCKRNISKCPKCQQPVTTQEKESHEKLHEQITCECGEVMEQQLLEEHLMNNCLNRDIICTYCELPIKYCDLESHQSYCGSRTDICTICNQYVTLKNMQRHISTNCEYPPKRRSTADRLDLLRQEVLAATQLSGSTFGLTCTRCDHTCEDFEALQTHLTTQCPRSPHLQHENEDKIPCEYCNHLVTVSSYMEHSATCGLGSELEMLDDLDYHGGKGGARRQKKQERKLQAQIALKQSLKSDSPSKRSMKYQPPPTSVKNTNATTKPALPKNPNRMSAKAMRAAKEDSKSEAPVPSDTASNDNQIDLTVGSIGSTATTAPAAPTDNNNTTPAKATKAPVRLKATRPAVRPPKSNSKQSKPTSTTSVIDLTASDNLFVALPDSTGIAVQGTSVPKQRTTNPPKKQPAKRPTARTAA